LITLPAVRIRNKRTKPATTPSLLRMRQHVEKGVCDGKDRGGPDGDPTGSLGHLLADG